MRGVRGGFYRCPFGLHLPQPFATIGGTWLGVRSLVRDSGVFYPYFSSPSFNPVWRWVGRPTTWSP
jgi:hypothetical protein